MNLILILIAILIHIILFIPSMIVSVIIMVIAARKKQELNIKSNSQHWLDIAIALNQLGNVMYSGLFNIVLIKTIDKNKFGNPDEVLSSVHGKNKLTNNLTNAGKLVASILDYIDDNHVIKSIEKDEHNL